RFKWIVSPTQTHGSEWVAAYGVIDPAILKTKEAMDLNTWRTKKRHFRDTDEWRRKKNRIINKMRALSRINLLLVLSKMQLINQHKKFEHVAMLELFMLIYELNSTCDNR
ncbi:unnamed protein product, partial [Haemonchus placei]|uniref:BZIP domain-containing protein n=1 Tax=Haemonchus placei TaxID=6290 RepID=A0A0N4X5N0_HAEPC